MHLLIVTFYEIAINYEPELNIFVAFNRYFYEP